MKKLNIIFSLLLTFFLTQTALGQDTADSSALEVTRYEDSSPSRLRFGLAAGYGFRDWTNSSGIDERPLERGYKGNFPNPFSDYAHGSMYFVEIIGRYRLSQRGRIYFNPTLRIGLERVRERYNSNERFTPEFYRPYPVNEYAIKFSTDRYLIQIPLLIKLIANSDNGFTIALGPYLNIVTANYHAYEERYTQFNRQGEILSTSEWGFSDTELAPLRRFTYGFQFEMGHEFWNGLGIKFFLSHALTNTYDYGSGVYDGRIGLKVSYLMW